MLCGFISRLCEALQAHLPASVADFIGRICEVILDFLGCGGAG